MDTQHYTHMVYGLHYLHSISLFNLLMAYIKVLVVIVLLV